MGLNSELSIKKWKIINYWLEIIQKSILNARIIKNWFIFQGLKNIGHFKSL